MHGRWRGRTVVCIASGPSLCADDVEQVRRWREEAPEERGVIVANTTYQIAPWADVLFAMDTAWWQKYLDPVRETFQGECYTTANLPAGWGITRLKPFKGYGNSGAACISLAVMGEASRVVLIGYDCQRTGGKAHWHGDHPAGLGNAPVPHAWVSRFAELANDCRDVKIVNCSRESALDMFDKRDLESVLAEASASNC